MFLEVAAINDKPLDGYVLKSSEGRFFLVLESDDSYWMLRVVKKLQGMREKDLKEVFISMEEDIHGF